MREYAPSMSWKVNGGRQRFSRSAGDGLPHLTFQRQQAANYLGRLITADRTMNIKGGDVRQTSPTLRDGLHAQGWAEVSSAPTFMTDPKETRVGRSDPPFLLLLRSAQVRVQAEPRGAGRARYLAEAVLGAPCPGCGGLPGACGVLLAEPGEAWARRARAGLAASFVAPGYPLGPRRAGMDVGCVLARTVGIAVRTDWCAQARTLPGGGGAERVRESAERCAEAHPTPARWQDQRAREHTRVRIHAHPTLAVRALGRRSPTKHIDPDIVVPAVLSRQI
jgi:hypothetical protein